MDTITKNDLRPGTLVLLDDRVRVVKRVVRHPAGEIIQWQGKGDFAATHNSLSHIVAAGVIVRR